jgi:hypothetical protein
VSSPVLVIDTEDYRGKRIIFTYKKWQEKSKTHPDLLNKTFLKNLKETIEEPEEVWQDYSDKRRKRCYYKKYSISSYVKAVVWVDNNPCHIITAFQTNYIRENKYPTLKRLR